ARLRTGDRGSGEERLRSSGTVPPFDQCRSRTACYRHLGLDGEHRHVELHSEWQGTPGRESRTNQGSPARDTDHRLPGSPTGNGYSATGGDAVDLPVEVVQ